MEIGNWKLERRNRFLSWKHSRIGAAFRFRIPNFHDNSAFTLIELLVVIVIIGILAGLLTPALRHTRDNAKNKRTETERATLTAAIWAYRHEYGRWPCLVTSGVVTNASNNWTVINYLTNSAPGKNELGVRFIDAGNYTFDRSGNVLSPWKSQYVIVIDLDSDTVTVQ